MRWPRLRGEPQASPVRRNAPLLGRQVARDVHGHALEPELLRRPPPRVAGDDDALGVHHDGLTEAELADALDDRGDGVVVVAGVARVGTDRGGRPQLDLHVVPRRFRMWARRSLTQGSCGATRSWSHAQGRCQAGGKGF